MLRVWVGDAPVGVIDRLGRRGTTFSYDVDAPERRDLYLTMPFQVASYDSPHGVLPTFDMNLPEGTLRARLAQRFAKATGTFDDFDLLSVVGRSQIGRVRVTGMEEGLDAAVPFQSVDEVLRARRGGELLDYLLDAFAAHSGLSGVQPKFMIRDEGALAHPAGTPEPDGERRSPSVRGATHIVKFWDPDEYPELAANEFFCLDAARRLGLDVPNFRLSENGQAIVIDRFDHVAGGYRGFEDFCVLNGAPSSEKYKGGYETRLFRTARDFLPRETRTDAMRRLFRLFVLNCAVRNGDAHMKNFGLVYDDPRGPAALAPVYDVVTTRAYLPKDAMALTLNGSTNWPDRKRLTQLGQVRADMTPSGVAQVFEATADALSDAAPELRAYFADSPHPEVGERMLAAWEDGIAHSLGIGERTLVPAPGASMAIP